MIDCLVVGAGPVGLMLASDLASRGCTVRIIDRLREAATHAKASIIHARTLEVLPEVVADKTLQEGHRLGNVVVREARPGHAVAEPVINLDMSPIEGYHMIFTQRQHHTEQYLADFLRSLPDRLVGGNKFMEVERGVELISFLDGPHDVECQLWHKANDRMENVRAKYIVGCDGSNSQVRQQLGLLFQGESAFEYFFAMDAALEGSVFEPNGVDIVFSSGADPMAPGLAFNVPYGDGNSLVVVDLDHEQKVLWMTSDPQGVPALRQPTPQDVVELLRKRGCGERLHVQPGSVRWIAHFGINSRQAEHYGRGHALLAGDACHCHTPLGGQGMNMGIQDAKNLAWKVAMVSKGAAPDKLLRTYESERKNLEEKLLSVLQRVQDMAREQQPPRPLASFLLGRGRRLASLFHGVSPAALRYASQQGWNYRESPLSVEHWERPVPSCRPLSSLCSASSGYRRQQALHRRSAARLHAGDRVPNVRLPAEPNRTVRSLHSVLKRSRGWTLLLFEGSREDNEEMRMQLPTAELFDLRGLVEFGRQLRMEPDESGFVAMVDEVAVFPAADEAHQVFGVHAQCLFLVRPDHYVGLRCEPIRRGAVLRYFRTTCGVSHGESESGPLASSNSDWTHVAGWLLMLGLVVLIMVCFGPWQPGFRSIGEHW